MIALLGIVSAQIYSTPSSHGEIILFLPLSLPCTQATVVCDVLVLYVLGKRAYYRKKKYLNVNNPGNVERDYDIIQDEDKVCGSRDFTSKSHDCVINYSMQSTDSAAGPTGYGSTHFEKQ